MVAGGNAHGLGQSTCVSLGAPLPPHIKEQGGGRPALVRPKERRNPPPSRSRIHPFLVQLGRGRGREGRRGREGGNRGRHPPPCPIQTPRGWPALGPLLYLPQGPCWPISSPEGSDHPPTLRKIPESLGTFPMSEYSRPIYRSLHLDHFETPRHVSDLIRDFELPSVH